MRTLAKTEGLVTSDDMKEFYVPDSIEPRNFYSPRIINVLRIRMAKKYGTPISKLPKVFQNYKSELVILAMETVRLKHPDYFVLIEEMKETYLNQRAYADIERLLTLTNAQKT